MAPRVSRQSEYYPTTSSLAHQQKSEFRQRHVHFAAQKNRTPSHLVNGPGIGRLGTDPR